MTIVKFIFNSNLWLASGATALSAFCQLYLLGEIEIRVLSLTFFYFVFAYTIHGINSLRQNRLFDQSAFQYYQSKVSLWVGAASLLLYSLSFIDLPTNLIYFGIIFILLGSIYGIFKLPNSKRYAKDFLSVKTIGTVLVITSFLIVIPYNLDDYPDENKYYMLIYFIAVHVLCNTVMGDLRDIQVDKANKVETIVTKLGFVKIKFLLILLLTISICFFVYTKQAIFIPTNLIVIATLLLIKSNSKILTYHYIDCVHFVPLLSLLFISIQ